MRIMMILLSAVLALSLTACGSTNSMPGGATGSSYYNKIAFEKVEPGQEPEAVAQELEKMKAEAGTKSLVVDGTTYAIITAGEKPSGGYDVVVKAVGDTDGKLRIDYRFMVPSPGTVNTSAMTYPSAVVKFENPSDLPVAFHDVTDEK